MVRGLCVERAVRMQGISSMAALVPATPPDYTDSLACRLVRGDHDVIHAFSVTPSGKAYYSSWAMKDKEVWRHEPISLPSLRSFLPVVILPALSSSHLSALPVDQLGFCSINAENGEIYHVFRFVVLDSCPALFWLIPRICRTSSSGLFIHGV